MGRGEDRILFSLLCPLLTAAAFAVLPQSFHKTDKSWSGPLLRVDRSVLFVDAAPRSKKGFRVGIFVPPYKICNCKCPPWVGNVQQVELFGVLQLSKLAFCMKWSRVAIAV